MERVELLSPAGSLEKLKFAVQYGADAVYFGGKGFNLRAGATNLSLREIEEAINYARSRGVKSYITLNAFARNDDIERVKEFVKSVAPLKPDAFIVSDLGVLSTVKETAPEIDVHISTQANTTNYKAARVYKSLGASRVILARELSIPEIREIKEKAEIEVEVFVHGAMCMAYSGRCLLSTYLSSRDSNQGACSQSCRWKFYLVEEKRPGEYFPIEEDDKGTYILNSKDLCALPLLPELIEAGVDSLKIEGRMKSSYYVAVSTAVYKRALKILREEGREAFYEAVPKLLSELEKISHRPYTTAFLGGEKRLQHYSSSSYIRNYKFLAYFDGSRWLARNRFSVGDEVEVFSPNAESFSAKIASISVLKKGEFRESSVANPNQVVRIKFDREEEFPPFSLLRRKEV
jgi:putative protease